MILLIAIGFLSGILSGMGVGGGAILIPALAIFFDTKQQMAQSINLLYFIPTAIVALFTHAGLNNIEFKVVKKLILFGVIGAIVGSFVALNLSSDILRKMFGGFLLIMGLLEIFKKK